MSGMALQDLADWLAPVDQMQVECDGASRVISMLLQREGIDHVIETGSLNVPGVGRIPYHWWIRLGESEGAALIDYRARMWLGSDPRVPHGVFMPADTGARFKAVTSGPADGTAARLIFLILAGVSLERYPTLGQHVSSESLDGAGLSERLRSR